MTNESRFNVMNPYENRNSWKNLSGPTDPFNPEAALPGHVQRMAKETQTVVTNLKKLDQFIGGTVFANLPQLDKQLLTQQRDEMVEYAKILSLRYCMALLADK